MKLKTLAFSMLLSTSLNCIAAGTVPGPVTIVLDDGSKYRVYVEQGTFNNLSSKIQSSPLWGTGSSYAFPEEFLEKYDTASNSYRPNYAYAFTYGGEDYYRYESPYAPYAFWPENGPPQGLGVWYSYGDDQFRFAGRESAEFGLNSTFYWLLGFRIPSASDTLASMQPNAAVLRNAFNLQSAKIAQGLSYDCSVFDAKNICVSFAGTRSDGKGGLDDTRGALIFAHKPNANVRFGGYIDQAFDSSESGGLKVKHSSPGYGVFAVWSEKADGSGLQVRGSASFGKADVESTRSEVGTAEAGFGKSDIKSNGFQIEASRDYAVNALWSARPYVGFRQLTNRRASYSETDSVVFPLSYSSIKQSTQSLLAGVRFAHTISAQTTMTVAAGLEHDIKNDVDRYEASEASIGDIDSIDMEDGKKNTRPTLSLGLTHVIDKAQRIGVSITHRKEAFESGSTTSGMVQYSRGF